METTSNFQIHTALIQVNRKVEAIKKGRQNKEQGYKFRGIDDAYNELHDLFADAGIVILPKYISSFREERKTRSGGVLIYSIATFEFTFMAEDGSRETITLQGEGMDTGDKSLNKAFSAALKYALMSMFLIPTDDLKDSENESHEVMAKQEPEKKQVKQEPRPISDDEFARFAAKLRETKDKLEAGNLLAKTRRMLTFDNAQENIITQITDNI